jgi:serine/threonine protein kinase
MGAEIIKFSVGGVSLEWNVEDGVQLWAGLSTTAMLTESTIAGLMIGLESMVGTERFNLALQAGGRDSVKGDLQFMSRFPTFEQGFEELAQVCAVAGWGRWTLIEVDRERKHARFRVANSWEGIYQKQIGVSWGSRFICGKFAGLCSSLFHINCWAEQTRFIARGDPYDEIEVAPSTLTIESELDRLLYANKATSADLAVALAKLQEQIREKERVEQELRRQIEQRSRRLLEILLPKEGPLAGLKQLPPGSFLADCYRVVRVLGEGGMGIVYEVERTTDHQRLAAKVLRTSPDRPGAGRFVREAQILARLNHPNLISISDIDITSTGILFIVMELVSGVSLGQLRHRFGPSHQRWGLHVLRQLAAALSVLHAEGIVHRDLKPDNLLVVRPDAEELPMVKLADFGIAILLDDAPATPALEPELQASEEEAAGYGDRVTGGVTPGNLSARTDVNVATGVNAAADVNAATIDLTGGGLLEAAGTVPGYLGSNPREPAEQVNAQTITSRERQAHGALTRAGTLVGTPLYMAPELAYGSRHARPPADIFSFGIMAFEILTGKLPFERPAILSRILREEVNPAPALLPHLGAPLAEILMRCLSMAPEQRPTAQEIYTLLAAIDLPPGSTTAASR